MSTAGRFGLVFRAATTAFMIANVSCAPCLAVDIDHATMMEMTFNNLSGWTTYSSGSGPRPAIAATGPADTTPNTAADFSTGDLLNSTSGAQVFTYSVPASYDVTITSQL